MSQENEQSASRHRLIVLALCLTFGFSVIIGQLVRFQILRHKELEEEKRKQAFIEIEVPSRRGYVVDVLGRVLAMDVVQWDISASPPFVYYPEEAATHLSTTLGLAREPLLIRLSGSDPWFQIARQVPQEVGERVAAPGFSGITCRPLADRIYPEGSLASHVLGIVNFTGVGFHGVEGYYNELLKAIPGRLRTEKRPDGQEMPIPPLVHNPPKAGTSLVLTLDLNIQYIVQQELLRALEEYEAQSGTVIVMDPITGAILASVSYPTYDPNDFANAELGLLSDPAVSSMWEPGSIFKIVTWAAALDAGTISRRTTYRDRGSLEVGGRTVRNWDRKANGLVTMEEGLVKSLNTVAAFISTSLGQESFYQYLKRFGVGSLTGVDLASEGPGILKLPGDDTWFPSDLATNSFGQGIAVTPMQMIMAVSPVANDGLLVRPHIVHQFITQSGDEGTQRVIQVEPTIIRRAISIEAANTMTEMLVQVVEKGAVKAQVPGYRIAGKTGTAQVPTPYGYHPKATVASFVGYAPANDPRFVVLIKLDRPKASPWGSQTAAPTFRAIAERLFVYMQIPPDEIRAASVGQAP
jgi:cell division protein FtsI/penicillin-binding protein 2